MGSNGASRGQFSFLGMNPFTESIMYEQSGGYEGDGAHI